MKTLASLLTLASLTTLGTLATFANASGPESTPTPPNDIPVNSVTDAFLAAWSNGSPGADLNQDGGVDGSDLETFFLALAHPLSRADTNGDGRVSAEDLAELYILVATGDARADLNNDGGVDGEDVAEWFMCANSISLENMPWETSDESPERDGDDSWDTYSTDER